MREATIEHWRLIETSPGTAVLIGRVSRSGGSVGAITITSPVARLTDGAAVTRSGSVYHLGEPLPADQLLPRPYADAMLTKMLRSGPTTPEQVHAVRLTAERCGQPGAAAGETLLARLRGGDA
ncbi:hypothetical protein GAY28_00410 [Azospirillum brasilense]|nr:hypothetical protein [Azospirillum brasilense]